MKVRLAKPEDTADVIRLGLMMHEESPNYREFGFAPNKIAQISQAIFANPDQLHAWTAEDDKGQIIGFLAVMVQEYFFSYSLHAVDLALYMHPEYRGGTAALRLIARAEEWARSRGCLEMRFGETAGIAPEAVSRLYKALGYRSCGTLYAKAVNPF